MPITVQDIKEILATRERHSGALLRQERDNAIRNESEERPFTAFIKFIQSSFVIVEDAGLDCLSDAIYSRYQHKARSVQASILQHPMYDAHFKSALKQTLYDATNKNSRGDLILSRPAEAILESALNSTTQVIKRIYLIERNKPKARAILLEIGEGIVEKKPQVALLLKSKLSSDIKRADNAAYKLAELLVDYPDKARDICAKAQEVLKNSYMGNKEGVGMAINGTIAELRKHFASERQLSRA